MKKATKNDKKGGHAVEKKMSLTQILLYAFFFKSVFITSWFLIRL